MSSYSFKYDVFISYSHQDETWVQQWLLPHLEATHLKACIDFRDFQVGAPSVTEMERAVLQSRKTILVLTPAYVASEWAEFENILAQTLDPAARHRRMLPLLLKGGPLPLRIKALTYVDFTQPENHDLNLERLLKAIRSEDLGFPSQVLDEKSPDAETQLKRYLKHVAEIFAPLSFPLALLSEPIFIDEVYVDLPIIKPPNEEALLRPLRPGQHLNGESFRQADEILQRNNHAAIVGIMGSGKTTTLRYLTWVYSHRPPSRVYWREDTLVPFYAQIRDLAALWVKSERGDPQRFIRQLAQAVSSSLLSVDVESILRFTLEQGNALILLDALDEFQASDQERIEFILSLQTVLGSFPLFKNNHVLITSRPYHFLNPMGFRQYAVQDLQNPERLVYRLGRAILKRVQPDLSETEIESWVDLVNTAIMSPRLRNLSSPIYITLMVYLGTSQSTAEESVALINSIERPADPYRYFLLKTIEWEKLKGNEPGMVTDQALLILGYAGYHTFVERSEVFLSDRIAKDLEVSVDLVVTALEFWKNTGLLWENALRSELGFRHSGFQAFAVALALRDMELRSRAREVNELWQTRRWDYAWHTPLELYMSLGGEAQP
ncbi:hypothetical protein ANRL3_00282 [Anaerolineae bacterium]|nr:hypothetical protein ANRL3_00282 [Anaerolineae bacterium]